MSDTARFALHIAVHLFARYAHLSAASITVKQLRWARIGAAAIGDSEALVGHNHAFRYDEAEKRFIEVEVVRKRDGLAQWCGWLAESGRFSICLSF
jgi:urate oxidase